jgi:hypothetical protein
VTVEARTYPLPRRNRVGPSSSLDLASEIAQGAAITPPRGRVFPFVFNITANTRRTISTPLLVGPAILKRIFFTSGTAAAPPNQSLEFGWAPIQVQEAGVLLATVRPYTVLSELLNPFAVMAAASGQGFPITTFPNTHVRWNLPVDLIVTEPRFSFCVSLVNNSASASEFEGYITVLEAVNADALATYTGS